MRYSVNLAGFQRSSLLFELSRDVVGNLFVFSIDEVHPVIVAVLAICDNVFLHQEALCLLKHLPLGDLFILAVPDKSLRLLFERLLSLNRDIKQMLSVFSVVGGLLLVLVFLHFLEFRLQVVLINLVLLVVEVPALPL